jgi:predicted transcriptional regulator
MSANTQELDSFVEFARRRIENGKTESLAQLFQQWETSRENTESIEAIRQGLAEARAGEGIPVAEAFADIRAKLGLGP